MDHRSYSNLEVTRLMTTPNNVQVSMKDAARRRNSAPCDAIHHLVDPLSFSLSLSLSLPISRLGPFFGSFSIGG